MDTFRKGLAFVLALLVILTALPSLVLFNLERKAFATETYQQAFANDDFYARLPGILAESVSGSGAQVLPVTLQGLDQQDWEAFFRGLLPPGTLKVMGDQALDSTLSYLESRSSAAVLSLAPLKERLASEAGTRAVLGLMRTQPVCTLDEMARITLAVLNNQGLALCNPPDDLLPIVIPVIQGQMQVMSSAIPAEVTLARVDGSNGQADPRQRIELARLLMRLSPVIPLLVLLLLTIVIVRALREWLIWWGWPLFITGFLAALLALWGAPFARVILLQLLDRGLPDILPAVLLSNGSRLAAAIVDQFLRPTLVQGLIMAALGILMLGASALLSWAGKRSASH